MHHVNFADRPSSRGSATILMLMASVIIGILASTVASSITNKQRELRRQNGRANLDGLMDDIRTILMDRTSCVQNLRPTQGDDVEDDEGETTNMRLWLAANPASIAQGTLIAPSDNSGDGRYNVFLRRYGIVVDRLSLQNLQQLGTNQGRDVFQADLVVETSMVDNPVNGNNVVSNNLGTRSFKFENRRLPLYLELDDDEEIFSCRVFEAVAPIMGACQNVGGNFNLNTGFCTGAINQVCNRFSGQVSSVAGNTNCRVSNNICLSWGGSLSGNGCTPPARLSVPNPLPPLVIVDNSLPPIYNFVDNPLLPPVYVYDGPYAELSQTPSEPGSSK